MRRPRLLPSKVKLNLKILEAEWELSHDEAKVLQNFLNELESRRAFEMNRGMALEEPIYVLASVVEFRTRLRDLANDLPAGANESRVVLLTAIDWAGEILDAWHLAMKEHAPHTYDFAHLDMHEMMQVMESVWPMIETVRQLLDKLAVDVRKRIGT